MKILEVTPFFKPMWEAGGVARVAYDVSKQLSERGHEVTVYTTNRCLYPTNIVPNVSVDVDGMKVYYFENLRKYFPWVNIPVIPYYLPIIAKKEIKYFDIIHIHDHRSLLAVIVCHYARKYGVPYVIQPHGSLPLLFGKRSLKRIFDMAWGDKILHNAEGIIALTSLEAEQVMQTGVEEKRVHVVANGIDLSQYENAPPRGEFRALYNIPYRMHVILYLGRLNPIKGVDLLIRAFSIVSKEVNNCVLVVVGPDDGSLLELKALSEELGHRNKVLFTGPLYGKDKSAAYCDSDIYVLPSYYEAFPMTVLEAWAFKKPVIVTENCGIKDLVQDSGLVVRSNPQDLATALLEYLQQDSLCYRHGQNGYNKLHESLSIQAKAGNVENLYREAIKSNDLRCFTADPSLSGFAEHDHCLNDRIGNKR